MKAQMTISLGMSDEEYHAMAEEISTEFVKNKTFSNVEIMYGRKPLGTVAKWTHYLCKYLVYLIN